MWGFSGLDPQSTYAADLLPWIVTLALGMGLVFVPLTLTAVHGVAHEDWSVASAVLNTMQQVGGTIGLAALSTVFVNNLQDKVAELSSRVAPAAGGPSPTAEQVAAAKAAIEAAAWTFGASRAYLVAAVMFAVGAVVTVAFLHVRHRELAHDGAEPVHVG